METKQDRDPYIWNKYIRVLTQQGTYEEEEEEDIDIIRYDEGKVKVKKLGIMNPHSR